MGQETEPQTNQRKKSPYRLRRSDWIVAAVIIAAALSIYGISALLHGNQAGDLVVISIDGAAYGTYNLSKDQEIDIQNDRGHNHVTIQDGKVWMAEADCPDQYCAKESAVSQNGQTIVCLPHRLVVEVQAQSKTGEEVDAIVQ